MSNELEDWQLALLVEARSYNNPALVEANAADALNQYRGLIDDAKDIDSPVVVDRKVKEQHEEAESLLDARSKIDGEWELVSKEARTDEQDALSDVKELLADALKENYGIKGSVVESMSASAMVNQFRDDDTEEIALESLAQMPETGGQDAVEANAENKGESTSTEDDPDDPDAKVENLSADERDEVRTKLDKAGRMESRTPEYAESLREEAAGIVGVESADDINVEAL